MLPPLKLTLAPWYNKTRQVRLAVDRDGISDTVTKGLKCLALSGPLSQYQYGTATSGHRSDHQVAIICTPQSGVISMDVDNPVDFAGTKTAKAIEGLPISRRGDGCHYLLDMRQVPVEQWPAQGPIPGGDIKSNGFIPVPGSQHYSGECYAPVVDDNGNLCVIEVTAGDDLHQALIADRARTCSAGTNGYAGELGDGQEPQLLSYTGGLVFAGLDKEDAWTRWLDRASNFTPAIDGWPWTSDDRDVFDRHWAYCTRMQDDGASAGTTAVPTQALVQMVQAGLGKPGIPVCHAARAVRGSNAAMKKVTAEAKYRDRDGRWKPGMHWVPSSDWKNLTDAHATLYHQAFDDWSMGVDLTAAWFGYYDPDGDLLPDISSPSHPLLGIDANGNAVPLLDVSAPVEEETLSQRLGWRYDRLPGRGDIWRTDEAAFTTAMTLLRELVDRKGNKPTTRVERCRLMNDPGVRKEHGLENMRMFSTGQDRAVMNRLNQMAAEGDENGVYKAREMVTTRRDHRFVNVAPIYKSGINPLAENGWLTMLAWRWQATPLPRATRQTARSTR